MKIDYCYKHREVVTHRSFLRSLFHSNEDQLKLLTPRGGDPPFLLEVLLAGEEDAGGGQDLLHGVHEAVEAVGGAVLVGLLEARSERDALRQRVHQLTPHLQTTQHGHGVISFSLRIKS